MALSPSYSVKINLVGHVFILKKKNHASAVSSLVGCAAALGMKALKPP
jgi:hypothetical protein